MTISAISGRDQIERHNNIHFMKLKIAYGNAMPFFEKESFDGGESQGRRRAARFQRRCENLIRIC